jgi:hypothetical protein
VNCYFEGVVQRVDAAAGAGQVAAWQIALMVKPISLVGIFCFCLVAAGAAVCQSKPQAASELPDAPSATLILAHPFQSVGEDAQAPVPGPTVPRLMIADRGAITEIAPVAPSLLPRQTLLYQPVPDQKDSNSAPLFFKYLTPARLHPSPRYMASDRDSLMGRASDAASRIFVTRNEEGKRSFNTAYLLRLATSIAAHSASRTYRARSGTAPLSDFGSTVGNDAGMNLLHEFGPAVRKMTLSHVPEFVSRIEERITR